MCQKDTSRKRKHRRLRDDALFVDVPRVSPSVNSTTKTTRAENYQPFPKKEHRLFNYTINSRQIHLKMPLAFQVLQLHLPHELHPPPSHSSHPSSSYQLPSNGIHFVDPVLLKVLNHLDSNESLVIGPVMSTHVTRHRLQPLLLP